ncbi:cell wall hydrolase [Paenibacillus sp. 1P07SE]|uniref:cell wall hydrolase n=1 Tax=Paenibacillus sp. 1P07SE TaxID=3132209 RepID=UPI0039A453C3
MKRLLLLILVLMTITATAAVGKAEASTPLLKLGSQGAAVKELKTRLHALGYYSDAINATYGQAAEQAVIRYQETNGLLVDGIAGPETLGSLDNQGYSLTEEEINLIARIIYSEARGESYDGQVGVGAVILNRMTSDLFPDTVRDVIMQPNAFTVVHNGRYNMKPDATAYQAALDAAAGVDPTSGALFFYNPDISTSTYFNSRSAAAKIGNHQFTF